MYTPEWLSKAFDFTVYTPRLTMISPVGPASVGISVVQLDLQVLIIEFGSLVFGCVPLDLTQWFICIGLGSLSLPVGLFLRCITLPASFTMCQETSVVEKVPSARTKTLWRRSLKRLQVQMRVVKAFQKSVTQQKVLH
ncbi:hypothetical protein DYB35_012387 [Aphanomyces astaci]|uniref:Plasma membrane calcium transporting P-type ATPase C-terminal domain-containing protein n=1 Tax=Aphanomyces astaci TaxID=112090 RepID=A0A3R6ZTJ9_APHAT|nr:hypothetical protein DYB35_012387 [Aphanomyces astaci]